MSEQFAQDHNLEALKVAASWPGADKGTLVTLATLFAATGADLEGLRYFQKLAASQPDQTLPLTLAGYFGVRAGEEVADAVAMLNDAADRDLGPAQYYRGLALASLPAEAGHAAQAVADLEFVLAVRDQFPSNLIRAAYHGLASAYKAAGKDELAAQAAANSGMAAVPDGLRLQFSGGWTTGADGYHFAAPRIAEIAPRVVGARGYDFADFSFVTTEAGVVAVLVHGHTLLTEQFTAEAVPGLLAALTELRDRSLKGIRSGLTLTDLLALSVLPEVLRDHPAAVGPYLAIRDHFVQRLQRQHSGYWQPDGSGMEPIGPEARAAALDLLAGGSPEKFADTVRTLLAQRDAELALEIAAAGLRSHPDHPGLAQLRQQALYRLMERHQLQDPFRYLIYAEMAEVEVGPVGGA